MTQNIVDVSQLVVPVALQVALRVLLRVPPQAVDHLFMKIVMIPNYQEEKSKINNIHSSDSEEEGASTNYNFSKDQDLFNLNNNIASVDTIEQVDMLLVSNSAENRDIIVNHTNQIDLVATENNSLVVGNDTTMPIEPTTSNITPTKVKSEPIHVNEMCFEDFYDWKSVCNQNNFNLTKDEDNHVVKLPEVRVIRVSKDDTNAIFYKNSYAETDFKKAVVLRKKRNNNIEIKNLYNNKPGLAERKKSDLMDLINKKLIPGVHRSFYESL
ncbi:unnamed protein product [Spodoptera littoralis]|uniref:Uncharacterized protein n=1 Tax=Spodoptera littoralis TaxID=7109 RepID=A0A9P0I670_SPOLI|nr:unnamed protein product [Spodoptera littoralis]CAH1640746.1 unnamed protein product [Spodoptera littoralis]